jgi:hypothetical protein
MATSDFSNIGLYNFMFYASFCILFLIFSLYTGSKSPILMFIVLSYILQFALNSAATSNPLVCDKTNPLSAAFFTLIPWLLILGVGNAALYYFPGWVRIFANSFGMWFAYKLKQDDVKINDADIAGTTPEYQQLYRQLVLDPKRIINEIDFINKSDKEILEIYKELTVINPTIFGKELNDGAGDVEFIPKITPDPSKPDEVTPPVTISKRADSIIKTVKLKNKIGYLIWNILLGTVASMISTNSLINAGCKINLL